MSYHLKGLHHGLTCVCNQISEQPKVCICVKRNPIITLLWLPNLHTYNLLLLSGCGKLWVIDGQWKLMFSHCMMQRKVCHNHSFCGKPETLTLNNNCSDFQIFCTSCWRADCLQIMLFQKPWRELEIPE